MIKEKNLTTKNKPLWWAIISLIALLELLLGAYIIFIVWFGNAWGDNTSPVHYVVGAFMVLAGASSIFMAWRQSLTSGLRIAYLSGALGMLYIALVFFNI